MDRVPNRWYAVLRSAEVPAGRAVTFERMGEHLVWWRDARGDPRCAPDRCPHRGASFDGAAVRDGAVACPYHGFRFGPDGSCVALPAHPDHPVPRALRLDVRAVREAHGFLWLWSGPAEAPPGPPPFFDFGDRVYAGSEHQERWETHYARVVENELDFAHLPFVHHNTIGRGYPEEVDLTVEQDGDRLRLRQGAVAVELWGPNLWRMDLGPRMTNFIAFAPVHDGAVVLYLRTYQRIVTVPGLAWLVGLANRLANRVVLGQDARTVPTQRPRVPTLTAGHVFVPSDRGIVAYLRWRDRCKAAADAPPDGGL